MLIDLNLCCSHGLSHNSNWLSLSAKWNPVSVKIQRKIFLPMNKVQVPPRRSFSLTSIFPDNYAELRNVNSFTWSKTVKPNFTRRKTLKLQLFWHLNWTKLTKKIFLENNCWPPYQIKLVYTHKYFTLCTNLPKKGQNLPNWMFSQTFTPTCQYF